MAFADKARARAQRPGTPCSVCAVLAAVPKKLRDEINDALADRTIDARAIHAELADRGLHCSYQQLGRHRRGDCSGRPA